MALSTAEKRKAVYQYYRSIGYTPEKARAMRGRWRSVFYDHGRELRKQRNQGVKELDLPKAPKLDYRRAAAHAEKQQLTKLGVPDSLAEQWRNLEPGVLEYRQENLRRYWNTVGEYTGKSKREIENDFQNILENVTTESEFYKALQDYYMTNVGTTLGN